MGGCGLAHLIIEKGVKHIDMRDELKIIIITDEYEYSEWIIDANC